MLASLAPDSAVGGLYTRERGNARQPGGRRSPDQGKGFHLFAAPRQAYAWQSQGSPRSRP